MIGLTRECDPYAYFVCTSKGMYFQNGGVLRCHLTLACAAELCPFLRRWSLVLNDCLFFRRKGG